MIHLNYVHYRRQYVKCGKAECKKCPHGPYWYAYTRERGKLKKRYLGKELPPGVVNSVRNLWPTLADRLLSGCDS